MKAKLEGKTPLLHTELIARPLWSFAPALGFASLRARSPETLGFWRSLLSLFSYTGKPKGFPDPLPQPHFSGNIII